jgi:hypothetical protein
MARQDALQEILQELNCPEHNVRRRKIEKPKQFVPGMPLN